MFRRRDTVFYAFKLNQIEMGCNVLSFMSSVQSSVEIHCSEFVVKCWLAVNLFLANLLMILLGWNVHLVTGGQREKKKSGPDNFGRVSNGSELAPIETVLKIVDLF